MDVILLVGISALGAACGLLGIAHAILSKAEPTDGVRRVGFFLRSHEISIVHITRRWGPATCCGLIVLALTRWPVAGLLGALAAGFAPSVIATAGSSNITRRVEAVATWTELLRDTLSASAGLGEGIQATAAVAPTAIRTEVQRLANRLSGGVAMSTALRRFAAEVDDSSCDLVASALMLAATARTQKLADLLSALADSTREEVSMRLRIEAGRASARSSVRSVVVFSGLFMGGLTVLAHSYLMPLASPTGEVVLLAVGACYASGIVLMLRLVRPRPTPRILAMPDELGEGLAR